MRHADRPKPLERRSRTEGSCPSVPPDRRGERCPETSHALIDLIDRAIRARVTPSTGSEEGKVCFFCEIKRSTIDTLVELRWLRADQRDDLAAIVTAFRCFVGRSLDIARNSGGVR